MELEATGVGRRRAGRQHDIAIRVGAKAIRAFLEPEQPGQREPALFGAQLSIFLPTPALDVGGVRIILHSDPHLVIISRSGPSAAAPPPPRPRGSRPPRSRARRL